MGVCWLDAGVIEVRNKRDFTNLSDLSGAWTLEIDGVAVSCGDLPTLRTAPGQAGRRCGFDCRS